MNEKSKLIIAIITVAAVAFVVVGATYAFWTWTTAENQRTTVSFRTPNVEAQIYANLEGGGSVTVQNLAPTSCTNTNYAMKRQMKLTYFNSQPQSVPVRGTLTVSNWTPAHGTISSDNLSHLHYALTKTEFASETACTTTNLSSNSNVVAYGTFPGGNGAVINNVKFLDAAASMASAASQTYYLYVWLDSDYTHQNVGDVVSDPMQELTFTLTWSGTMG